MCHLTGRIDDEEISVFQVRGGVYVVKDPMLNKDWRLRLDKIHDPVREFQKDGKTIYFTCSDFKTEDGKVVLDIDLWMVEKC